MSPWYLSKAPVIYVNQSVDVNIYIRTCIYRFNVIVEILCVFTDCLYCGNIYNTRVNELFERTNRTIVKIISFHTMTKIGIFTVGQSCANYFVCLDLIKSHLFERVTVQIFRLVSISITNQVLTLNYQICNREENSKIKLRCCTLKMAMYLRWIQYKNM